jgi:hypothetical protein
LLRGWELLLPLLAFLVERVEGEVDGHAVPGDAVDHLGLPHIVPHALRRAELVVAHVDELLLRAVSLLQLNTFVNVALALALGDVEH